MHKIGSNAASTSGLKSHAIGLGGHISETTAEVYQARIRHVLRLEFLDSCTSGPAGGRLLMLLVVNEIVLNLPALKEVVEGNSRTFRLGSDGYIEWEFGNGWRDRRLCSTQTANAVQQNGGLRVGKKDWRWASTQLQTLSPDCFRDCLWEQFVSDAKAWWIEWLTGPVHGHVAGLGRFQLLDRHALARQFSKLPQVPVDDLDVTKLDERLRVLELTHSSSTKTNSFNSLVYQTGNLARSKPAKDQGRAKILSIIDGLLPLAQEEGWTQVLILLATAHAIEHGGVSGLMWAPITIFEYTRISKNYLLPLLIGLHQDELDGQAMYAHYQHAISEVLPSQKAKFCAYLEAFHRFLVISGFDPLPHSLSGSGDPMPPDAAVIRPHEADRACLFIDHFSPSEQVRLQCNVAIRFGSLVPVRSYEPWCFRLEDVHEAEPVYVDIYPRRVDGQGKNMALRRQEGVDDLQLRRLLIDLKSHRRHANAAESDILFGEPGKPGLRHEQELCQKLVNAALRWATGNSRASYYDLRHTVFSTRASKVITGEEPAIANFDGFAFSDMSTSGGHTGPESSYAYIHLLEAAIAFFSKKHRAMAWEGTIDFTLHPGTFDDLCESCIDHNPNPLDSCGFKLPKLPSADHFGIQKRHEILDKVADNMTLSSVGGECHVPLEVVEKVVADFVQVLAQVQLVNYQCTRTLLGQCNAVMAYGLLATHARQGKYVGISRRLADLAASKNYVSLNLLWQSWLLCRDHEFLSLLNPRPALVLIKFLLGTGVSKRCMVVISEPGASPLDEEIKKLGLPSRPEGVDRNGRASHRLFFTVSGRDALRSKGPTISTQGFDWWMLVVGSFLLANEQI